MICHMGGFPTIRHKEIRDITASLLTEVCNNVATGHVRVFYPNASSNRSTNATSVYRRHEQAKKREYGQRIREVERGVFTPLVLSTNGGMGREASTFYKRLADLLSQRRQQTYSTVMGWLRCQISFASLRASIMCIRGSRSSLHRSRQRAAASVIQRLLHAPKAQATPAPVIKLTTDGSVRFTNTQNYMHITIILTLAYESHEGKQLQRQQRRS